jgi:hypothetical protein
VRDGRSDFTDDAALAEWRIDSSDLEDPQT